MNEQEEAGFWCRVVEGIDAEVEAASFAEKEVLELLQASFWALLAPLDGACAQGSGRRRLHPLAPAPFAHGCCTR